MRRSQARPANSRVSVWTRTFSPSFTNSGTRTSRPVSSLAAFVTLPLAVSPRLPISVSATVLSLAASVLAAYAITRIRYRGARWVGGSIFLAYLVLRAFGGTGEVEKRFAAGLAIVGLLDIPLIRYSVQRWRGTHPVVVTGKGGGIAGDMKPALYISSLLFVVVAIVFIWMRVRSERLRQRVEALELEAAERGLLEET